MHSLCWGTINSGQNGASNELSLGDLGDGGLAAPPTGAAVETPLLPISRAGLERSLLDYGFAGFVELLAGRQLA
eukprot:CAMPEP_0169412688 /NCGR_PEP_ID=MMETSP1017-20121227/60955_1 /TAXON_ID=342587 /ORGANISM="Karlodinium micrum, Strain CCMP2283" /LENGTH=73 /DNA_ID=CAMNT_0009520051 /DNA_START=472 /DNA_END=693 /DNA_ORIENTATION=+